jgi:4-hydroxythreonine-4-phosphate dehydrogenase
MWHSGWWSHLDVPKEVAVSSMFHRVFAVADDLSGAAETAMALSVRGSRSVVVLSGSASADVVVVDLDTRAAPASDAASSVTRALAEVPPGYRVFKKIDSLLRGNVAAEVGAVAAAGYGVVVTPALPVAGRSVRAGVLHVDGRPLHEGDAWRAEQATPPESVAAALAPAGVQIVGLAMVRSGGLAEVFADAAGRILVCDTETDADLDVVAGAAAQVPEGLALAGSGGLAAAVGRLRAPDPPANAAKGTLATLSAARGTFGTLTAAKGTLAAGGPVVVVGTADPVAVAQVELLDGFAVYSLDPGELAAGAVALPAIVGPTVVRVDPVAPVDPSQARAVATGLAASVAAVLPATVDLVLLGGETARRVLDALGVDHLEPVEAIHHGAVRSLLPDGGTVVTRPGSFGGPDSLVQIVRHLEQKGSPVNSVSPGNLPIVAVTMGDGAGIGPEVIVPAVLHPDTLAVCRPVVVGDAGRLRQAAGLVGVNADIVPVASPDEAVFDNQRVNVIDLGLLPADLPWGTLSAVAGEAAYQYVRVAAELAMAREVHGICTAPLNKEALHAAGHVFPGHTELLAHLTGVDEVSMMLSTPKVKVIHVTTHIGLIDAIARIEPGLVERTVRRGHEALVRAGNANPVIGVCGINPHAGEGGLFGYGEEEEKIVPALESLRAQGIDARGPLPADTAFFLAGRGDYDLIVAMYHDQGHGPVKVLGIEAGVNLTVGLPVIRTSVDHGTAFDIAGTGKADPRSMVEALRQAAELAAAP